MKKKISKTNIFLLFIFTLMLLRLTFIIGGDLEKSYPTWVYIVDAGIMTVLLFGIFIEKRKEKLSNILTTASIIALCLLGIFNNIVDAINLNPLSIIIILLCGWMVYGFSGYLNDIILDKVDDDDNE